MTVISTVMKMQQFHSRASTGVMSVAMYTFFGLQIKPGIYLFIYLKYRSQECMDENDRLLCFLNKSPTNGLPNRITQGFNNISEIWQKTRPKLLQVHLHLNHHFRNNLGVMNHPLYSLKISFYLSLCDLQSSS